MLKLRNLIISQTCPAIMGIVNVTPDSFSDGGLFLNPKDAIAHALQLVEEGADILDIGGESTRPGAEKISTAQEIERVIPVIEGIRKNSNVPISIDTTKSVVALAAIESGADMINDISAGRFDSEMFSVAAKKNVPICLMHMQGTPKTMQLEPKYENLMGDIKKFLLDAINSAVRAGVDRSKIIVDPGIGFGKTADDNLTILKKLDELCELNAPILIGASRKSFIGKKLGLEVKDRLEASLAAAAVATDHGAGILRVHDVAATRRFVDMYRIVQ